MQPVGTTFTTAIEGASQIPIERVKVFPTHKTVPSLGFNVAYYELDGNTDMIAGDWYSDPGSGVDLVYPSPRITSHDASFDTVTKTITADAGTPYGVIQANQIIQVQGSGNDDGIFHVASVAGDNVITVTEAVSNDNNQTITITILSDIIEPSTVLAFDWGVGGVPKPISKSHLFAVRWYGFFFARYTGLYRFYYDAPRHARIRVKFNGSYLDSAKVSGMAETHTATFDAATRTITAAYGKPYTKFSADDFIVISGTAEANNRGVKEILSVTDTVITLKVGELIADEVPTTTTIGLEVDIWTSADPKDGVQVEQYTETTSLTAGTFYSIQIEYWVPASKVPLYDPTFLAVKYREPNTTTALDEWGATGGTIVSDYDSDYPLIKPLSAGNVVSHDADGEPLYGTADAASADFLTGVTVTKVKSISGRQTRNGASEYTLGLPIANATILAATLAGGENAVTVDSVGGFPQVAEIEFEDGNHYSYTSTNPGGPNFAGVDLIGEAHAVGEVVKLHDAGYAHNPEDFSYSAWNSGESAQIQLKAFHRISVELGYQVYGGSAYYQERITGLIYPNPVIERRLSGDGKQEDQLTLRATDYRTLLQTHNAYFKNYPDAASYALARYYKDSLLSEPNGINKPTAYDRWGLGTATRDMLMKAGIDPVLLYARQRKNVEGGAKFSTDWGNYLIFAPIQLDSNRKYGRPGTILAEDADDAYNWFFGYGEAIASAVTEMAKNFLYFFSVNCYGQPIFRPSNLPSNYYNDSTPPTGPDTTGGDPPDFSDWEITITAPTRPTEWAPGNHNITWTSDAAGTVKIELYHSKFDRVLGEYGSYKIVTQNGWGNPIIATTADDGTYAWNLPTDLPKLYYAREIFYKIKITSLNLTTDYDFSDEFTRT